MKSSCLTGSHCVFLLPCRPNEDIRMGGLTRQRRILRDNCDLMSELTIFIKILVHSETFQLYKAGWTFKKKQFNTNISLSLNRLQFINPLCDVTNGRPITPPVKLIYQVGRKSASWSEQISTFPPDSLDVVSAERRQLCQGLRSACGCRSGPWNPPPFITSDLPPQLSRQGSGTIFSLCVRCLTY